jgi:hypothetical protein
MADVLPGTQLFEVSWEVCNKVGGIYTVITSKLKKAQAEFSGNYMAVGPYVGPNNPDFKELPMPEPMQQVAARLALQGISIHYGIWQTPEEPKTVLIDWGGFVNQNDAIKKRFWEEYKLDSLGSNFDDVDKPLLWSVACGLFVEAYAATLPGPIIAHGHEWLSAGMLLHLRQVNNPSIRTVFTTHATVLGRALSSANVFIYDKLDTLNPTEEAKGRGVTTKHQLEALAANTATIFTVVSKVTADEAAAFLGKPADVIVENGLNTESFPAFDELAAMHSRVRNKLQDFTAAYFFPHYRFDLDKTTFQFSMGRYEVHNKGYDSYLNALAKLNKKLKSQNSDQTVVAFILVPGDSIGIRSDTMRHITLYSRVQDQLHDMVHVRERDLYGQLWEGEYLPDSPFVPTNLRTPMQQLLSHLPNGNPPPISLSLIHI